MWILQDDIPEHVGIFIDDGAIKGPKSNYSGETLKENPGVRRFILEYAITLERNLFRIEEAGMTISQKMFSCCVPALDIVSHVFCKEERMISQGKLNKVLAWPVPKDFTQVWGFLGVCTYFQR